VLTALLKNPGFLLEKRFERQDVHNRKTFAKAVRAVSLSPEVADEVAKKNSTNSSRI
jgi:hypothetical protein